MILFSPYILEALVLGSAGDQILKTGYFEMRVWENFSIRIPFAFAVKVA